ncbi:hypothetical protein CMMCAS03_01155 [Clavibacter michiganensis subsp. michiganensis]|nr:hypothetical protein CMMCAS05_10325 [Clavibacter michiganensis subsp. michiganensis]OUD96249.1 hypothetical protein CMMCAS03_01155 [Clavibacter michiganensis subsp. michiganensis]
MSGFFFCGMIDDPVEKESLSVTNPNSRVFQRMISSLSRERSMPTWASTNANSATTSRAAVPSMEFSELRAKPRSRATAPASRPRVEPARAPDP